MVRIEDIEDPDEKTWQAEREAKRAADEAKIIADPELDYYDYYPAYQPKREIGQYVASQGFKVPLINSDEGWSVAFHMGTAMIRSELPQDYAGYSGILPSVVLSKEEQESIRSGWYEAPPDQISPAFKEVLGSVMLAGLRSGDIPPEAYIERRRHSWLDGPSNLLEAAKLGVTIDAGHDEGDISASRWKYIPGVNIRLFRDPNVDGRYHLGANDGSESGDFFDLEDCPETIRPRKCNHDLPVRKIVEFYEAIRNLPRFDQRQAPLIEMQMDEQGELYFLQYFKTNQLIEPVDEFELPTGDGIYLLGQARGVTEPEGREYKIYLEPPTVDQRLAGQAYYVDLLGHDYLKQELLASRVDMVMHIAYLLLKGNHWSTAAVYKPALAIAGLEDKEAFDKMRGLNRAGRQEGQGTGQNAPWRYIRAHVVSNGRKASLRTDWELHAEDPS